MNDEAIKRARALAESITRFICASENSECERVVALLMTACSVRDALSEQALRNLLEVCIDASASADDENHKPAGVS